MTDSSVRRFRPTQLPNTVVEEVPDMIPRNASDTTYARTNESLVKTTNRVRHTTYDSALKDN